MAHALIAFLLVIRLAPGAGLAKRIRPQMNGVAQELVAGPTDPDFIYPPRLIGDRRGPGDALEHLLTAVALRVVAHRAQQPGSQHLLGSRQAPEQIMVRMVRKERGDLLAVELELLAQGAEQLAQAHG